MKSEKICLLCAEKRRKYYKKNSTIIRNKSKSSYEKNRDQKLGWQKQYYQNNKEDREEYNKQYYQENKDRIVKQVMLYVQNRKKTDPIFKLRKKISADIWRMLKLNGGTKQDNSVIKFLPYTIQELKQHIEKQFESWMTWSNWGNYNIVSWDDNDPKTWKWSIDHIIPQSHLQYTSMTDENFQKCWS
ncbi:MAG: hypothetical protein ACREBJ_04030, partial [Nitrosotalea sp.]